MSGEDADADNYFITGNSGVLGRHRHDESGLWTRVIQDKSTYCGNPEVREWQLDTEGSNGRDSNRARDIQIGLM